MFRLLASIITLQRLYEYIYNDFARINIAKIYTFLLKEVAFFNHVNIKMFFADTTCTCISIYIANTTCILKKNLLKPSVISALQIYIFKKMCWYLKTILVHQKRNTSMHRSVHVCVHKHQMIKLTVFSTFSKYSSNWT